MNELAPHLQLALINDELFAHVQMVALKYFGFGLEKDKRIMVTRRLSILAEELGADSAEDVVRDFLVQPSKEVLQKFANCLTTNHTYFHREPQHYDRLVGDILPEVIERIGAQQDLRIWCAAASSGQEPYEIAMWVRTVLGGRARNWRAGILATDLSVKVLDEALAATYTGEQVASLPTQLQRDFVRNEGHDSYVIDDTIRKEVMFRRFNLLTPRYPFKRNFHLIFCRNVMIYFEEKVKTEVLQKLANSLEVGGYLFIGRSESARGLGERLRFLEPGLYKKES